MTLRPAIEGDQTTLFEKLYERLGFRRTGATDTHIEMSWTGHDSQQP